MEPVQQARILLITKSAGAESTVLFPAHADVELAEVVDIQSACRLILSDGWHYDLIVVDQDRPGQYAPRELELLRSAAPLAPIVFYLGSYCEGEARTGRPWSGAIRVYHHQFNARLSMQFERFKDGGVMSWAPPFTRTHEDVLFDAPRPQKKYSGARVGIISRSNQSAASLADALKAAGFSVVIGRDSIHDLRDVDALLWDCEAAFATCYTRFIQMSQDAPKTAKIVLLGFPRPEDVALARATGATAVVSKPFLLDDLVWQLRKCLSVRGSRARLGASMF